MAFYGAIVTALYKRERTGKGSHVSSNLMANGIWAASVLAQAKLCGATFQERRTREHALNAVTNHYKCKDGRWIILSLLNEEKQWPRWRAASAARILSPTTVRDQGRPPCALAGTDRTLRRNLRHQGPRRMAPDPRRQRPGVRRGRHPRRHSQRQADAGERGAGAVRERHHADHQQPDLGRRRQKGAAAQAAGIGEHSDEILRTAGYDEAAIGKLRASGAVA
jgi:formyl-CoA transferase